MKKYLTIVGVIVWIIIGLAGLTLLFSPKIVEQNIYPVVAKINGVTFIVCIGFLVMIIFRRLRPWAGLGLTFASYVFGFGWWVLSYIITVKTLGLFWLVIGVMFMGIGVLPLAFIGIIIRSIAGGISFWPAISDYLFAMIVCLIPMGLGSYLMKDY